MGTFTTRKFINGDPSLIPGIASRIESAFTVEGFTVLNQSLLSGSAEVSITKGGLFRAVLGMKTALKISLRQYGEGIAFEAGIGIFGQHVVPMAVAMLFFWPLVLAQLWALVQQSRLDDKALSIAEEYVKEMGAPTQAGAGTKRFCTSCGREMPADATFCPSCGAKQ